MIEMSLGEAQLFRMLRSFFGEERVLWNISVRTVCAGSASDEEGEFKDNVHLGSCLFTIVDDADIPKMVIELAPDFTSVVDTYLLERQEVLPKLLSSHGIKYVVFSKEEFRDILDPEGTLALVDVLKDRFGIVED
jgi:hypothetical protein